MNFDRAFQVYEILRDLGINRDLSRLILSYCKIDYGMKYIIEGIEEQMSTWYTEVLDELVDKDKLKAKEYLKSQLENPYPYQNSSYDRVGEFEDEKELLVQIGRWMAVSDSGSVIGDYIEK